MIKPLESPRDGAKLYHAILDQYTANYPHQLTVNGEQQDRHAPLLRDILHSALNRATAVNYSVYGKGFEERPSFRELKAIIDEGLPDANEGERRNAYFQSLANLTKTITFTPHPTEVLKPQGIVAEQKFMNFLLSAEGKDLLNDKVDLRKLFEREVSEQAVHKFLGEGQHEEINNIGDLLNALIQNIRTAITTQYPDSSMAIEQEIERALIMAERGFEAAPIIAARAAYAAGTPDDDDSKFPKRLSTEELKSLGNIIELQGWSPGDQDNKWQMRADIIQHGNKLSRQAIKELYGIELVKLISELKLKNGEGESQDAIHALESVLSGLTRGMLERDEYVPLLKKVKALGLNEEILTKERGRAERKPYKNIEEMEQELFAMRDQYNDLFDAKKSPLGEDTRLSTLDSLIVQTMNFGDLLLRTQVRQNQEDIGGSEQRLGAMQVIKKHLLEKKLINEAQAADPNKLVEAVYTDIRIGDELKSWLEEIGQTKLPGERTTTLQEEYEHNPYYTPDREKYGEELIEKFTVYHVMKTLQVAANDPEAIPNFIIAESEKPADVLNSLFIAKAMMHEKDGMDIRTNHPKFEIYPLFEHYDHINKAPETMREVFKNPFYKAQQESLGKEVKIYDPFTKQVRPKTVADRLREMGVSEAEIQQKPEGIRNKTLRYKRIMFAGSDSFKGGAVFMEPIMDEVKYKLERDLLDEGYEAYYEEGAGNAVYRKQPVNAPDETVQGNAMRWHPVEAAVRATRRLAETAINTFKGLFTPQNEREPQERLSEYKKRSLDYAKEKTAYHVNRSSLPHLRLSQPDQWENVLDHCHAGSQKYQELYNDPAYSSMLSLASASAFGKMIGFAARKASRERASTSGEKKASYPPKTDVQNLRAISYGASLMNSMHHLYYGMEAFATNGDGTLTKENAKIYAREYLELLEASPNLQNMVNRATYGVLMADMEAAWKFADTGIKRSESEKGEPSVEISGTKFLVSELAAMKNDDDRLSAIEDTEQRDAIICLAKIDQEHYKASLFLKELHQLQTKKVGNALSGVIPDSVHNEINDIRENIDPARHRLAQIHQELKDGKRIVPKKGSLKDQELAFDQMNEDEKQGVTGPRKTYEDIYYNMSVVKNALERPLTSMIYPEYTVSVDKAKGLAK